MFGKDKEKKDQEEKSDPVKNVKAVTLRVKHGENKFTREVGLMFERKEGKPDYLMITKGNALDLVKELGQAVKSLTN